MPPARKLVPSYLLHRYAGCGRAVWTDSSGVRRYVQFPGAFNSAESLSVFARLQAELAASPSAISSPSTSGRTLAEVLLAFLKHAEAHYRGAEDGKPTSEYHEYAHEKHWSIALSDRDRSSIGKGQATERTSNV